MDSQNRTDTPRVETDKSTINLYPFNLLPIKRLELL